MSNSIAYLLTLPHISDNISCRMNANGFNISDTSEGSEMFNGKSSIIKDKSMDKIWSKSTDGIPSANLALSYDKCENYARETIDLKYKPLTDTDCDLIDEIRRPETRITKLSNQNCPPSPRSSTNLSYCPSSPKLSSCFKPRSLSIDSSDTTYYSVTSLDNEEEMLLVAEGERLEKNKEVAAAKKSLGKARDAAGKRASNDKKKRTSWYNVLGSTYKSRREEFKKLFKLPFTEKFIVDYSCALQKDILVQGRLYVCQSNICFYANIFRWETMLIIPICDIMKLSKEKTALVIPNAIQITTKSEKYFFASFSARDKLFILLDVLRRNAASCNTMTEVEFWNWVQFYYGEELGLTTLDVDYQPPSVEEKNKFLVNIQSELAQHNSEASIKPTASSPEMAIYSPDQIEDSVDPPEFFGGLSDQLDEMDELLPEDATNCTELSAQLSFTPSFRVENSDEENTSEDDAGDEMAEQCLRHDHYPIEVVDEILLIPINQLFEFCFTDSELYQQFVSNKKTLDVVLPPWPDEFEADGSKVRNISYTLTLNYSIGPKHSPSTEKQIMFPDSIPGKFYLIDTECINGGIPYGECFYIVNRYCVVKLSEFRTRLRITSQIIYKKPVWGFVRNFLEKNVTAGIIGSFGVLADLLRAESNHQMIARNLQDHPHRRKLLRRHRLVDRSIESDKVFEAAATGDLTAKATTRTNYPTLLHSKKMTSFKCENSSSSFAIDVLSRCICFILLILLILNAVLFYKLWLLENTATFLFASREVTDKKIPSQSLEQNIKGASNLVSEWEHMINENRIKNEELIEWRRVLASSVALLDQMKTSLLQLRVQLTDENQEFEGRMFDEL